MDKILEKIKSLDKKVLIGAGIGVAAIVILIIVLVVGAGTSSDKKNPSNDTQNNTETNQGSMDESGTEEMTDDATENVTEDMTEVSTEEVTEEATEETNDSTNNEDEESGNSNSGNGNTGNGSTNNSNGGQSQGGSSNSGQEEIVGGGDQVDPYIEVLGEENTFTTVEIAAGKSVYYGLYRVGGKYLTIEDANAYVIYDGKKYEASNGKVSFQVGNALASDMVMFEIGNKGTSAATFTLKFVNLSGSYANPEQISSVANQNKSLEKGNETGHYYKYVAEKTGKLRFYIDSASKECELSVTNNATSMNRTFEADAITDANGKTCIEVEVAQGDVIMIHLCAKPDKRWTYPATDVVWHGEYI